MFAKLPKIRWRRSANCRKRRRWTAASLLLLTLSSGCCSPCGPGACVTAGGGCGPASADCGHCGVCAKSQRCCLTRGRLRGLLATLNCGRCGAPTTEEYHHPYFHPVPTTNVFQPRETYDATAMTANTDATGHGSGPADAPEIARPRSPEARRIAYRSQPSRPRGHEIPPSRPGSAASRNLFRR